MAFLPFEELHVFQLAEKLADEIWDIVYKWKLFEKDTVGKKLVRAADSIGANIAEGTGRGTRKDNQRFIRISRSLSENGYFPQSQRQAEIIILEILHCIPVVIISAFLDLEKNISF